MSATFESHTHELESEDTAVRPLGRTVFRAHAKFMLRLPIHFGAIETESAIGIMKRAVS